MANPDIQKHLTTARRILMREAETFMPSGAAQQRAESLAVLDRFISGEKPQAVGSAYENLRGIFHDSSALGLASAIIEWIHSTHSFPDIPDQEIEDVSAALSMLLQRMMLRPEIKEWIAEAKGDRKLGADEKRNLALMEESWIMSAGLSEAFVNELSRAGSVSFRIWEKARPANDFTGWLKAWSEVVKLAQKKAVLLGKALDVSPYQAMLEQYNAGLHNETVNKIFGELHVKLPGLLERITKKQAAEAPPLPLPPFPLEVQRRIIKRIIASLGFEPEFSRLDESAHPFSTGEWDDVRVTTHYYEDRLFSGIMGVVHEMGHLFYSRNLPRALKHQPIGNAQSMWIHESQSLFWEKQVGCSTEFISFIADIIAQESGVDSPALAPENLYRIITRVKPGLIRIEADEVTYPAHIILRHNIEQKIIAGKLDVAQLPRIWAEAMRELLDVEVPDDAHGCMQDVHWSDGTFGYFPAYSFGALAAAQFMESARKALPDMQALIRRGEFAPIQAWLREHIHEQGSRYGGEELVRRVTGKPLSIAPWIAHIERRYLDVET